MTKFTKGPWVKDRRGESLIGANSDPVCVWGCGLSNAQKNDERVANSHLIASAPDMYKLLELFIPTDEDGNGNFTYDDGSEYLGEQVELILAKARGE